MTTGFDRTTFSGDAWFARAIFCGDSGFDGTTFSGDTVFTEAKFIDGVRFDGTRAPRLNRNGRSVWPPGWTVQIIGDAGYGLVVREDDATASAENGLEPTDVSGSEPDPEV